MRHVRDAGRIPRESALTVHRASPVGVGQEDADDVGRRVHRELPALVVMVKLQRLDQQVVHCEKAVPLFIASQC